MPWDLDMPDLPFKKPKNLEILEEMTLSQREAMDPVEVKEHIEKIADRLTENCREKRDNSEWCQMIVQQALRETGGALGGKMGAMMVGLSEKASEEAVKRAFKE